MIRITKDGIIAPKDSKGLHDYICPICLETINELNFETYYEENTERQIQCCENCTEDFELQNDNELTADIISVKAFKEFMLYAVKNHKKNEKVWQYILKQAKEDKKWAKNHEYAKNPTKWPACKISTDMLIERLETPLEELAKKKYHYFEWRALTISSACMPLDPSARREWEKITGEKL